MFSFAKMSNMNREYKESFDSAVPLTLHTLEELKSRGFQYVRVNAFTHERRPDYMEPRYVVLSPLTQLSENREQAGIYEPIDSPILIEWANSPNVGFKVFVANC
jgi:hypothetical protein